MSMWGETSVETEREVATELSGELTSALQHPRLVLVTTLDAENGWPTNHLITWVAAVDPHTVRLAADADGWLMNNIRANDRVLLTVMTPGACHAVAGSGAVAVDHLEGVSLKLACAEVRVLTVRDVTFWGGQITREPEYRVTYEQALKEKLDAAVFAGMRAL